jgi:hypothetical protein
MVDALFLNHVVVTPSGKGIGAILLPYGRESDFQLDQDLQSIVMLNKVPNVTNDAKKLLGQHCVDDSNVHADALVASTKERHEKEKKEQGVNNVEDISDDFVRGRELDQIFFESRENITTDIVTHIVFCLALTLNMYASAPKN